jgi:hypothetical protein
MTPGKREEIVLKRMRRDLAELVEEHAKRVNSLSREQVEAILAALPFKGEKQ